MRIYDLQAKVDDDDMLRTYEDFIGFAGQYISYISAGKEIHPNIQADIVSVKENHYHFIQYKDDGHHCITRPINMELFLSENEFEQAVNDFKKSLTDVRSICDEYLLRENINRVIYTCQQCVGCTLDAFNNPNKARKRNGMLFEILIRSVINAAGIRCDSFDEVIRLGKNETMKFQHDIVLKNEEDSVIGIGQLKTTSKDRIDKIFLDKSMYNSLTKTDIPHFAVFLNDVQRASTKDGKYSISSTFLPGHFKAYTMALNPLDGVYYFDPRPVMSKDEFLSRRIAKFDKFLVEDMWNLPKKTYGV